MTKKILLLLVLVLCQKIGFTQNTVNESYTNYFKDSREIPFLHLNKTSFIKGEEIWFKAYVLEQNSKKLHQNTSNLHVALFDERGELKEHQLIKIKDGIGSGSIKIDSTFTNQHYFINASTNWMRNFKEAKTFVQQIDIVDNTNIKIPANRTETPYDLQLFPEGGHLVEEVSNTIGVLIKNKFGKGIKIKSGVVKDKSGVVIQEFTTNHLGLSKIELFYEKGEAYEVIVTLDNTVTISEKVPIAKSKGLILKVDNKNPAHVSISLATNKETVKDIKGKQFKILVHNTSSVYNWAHKFNSKDNFVSLVLKRSKIPHGTNVITVFNETGKPILERLFFNYQKSLFEDVAVNIISAKSDSIKISFDSDSNEKSFISASMLPYYTKANTHQSSIYASFLLNPYVKGAIENPNYYFKNTNRKKLEYLDLLLLTQGWSKYDWGSIFTGEPKLLHTFEQGVTIKGRLTNQTVKDSTNIFLMSDKTQIIESTPVVGNQFEFSNINLADNSRINLTIARSKLKKPKTELTYVYAKPEPHLGILAKQNKDTVSFNNFEPFVLTNEEVLDTVVLQYKSEPKHKPVSASIFTPILTENIKTKQLGILEYIQSRGFLVVDNNFDIRIYNRRAQRLMGPPANTNVYLDDIQIASEYSEFGNSLNIIQYTYIRDYEEIHISKFGNGTIYLYTNQDVETSWGKNRFFKEVSNFGYASKKEYYRPKYASNVDNIFRDYGAIYWTPEITINSSDSTSEITIPRMDQSDILITVMGVNESGKLIFKEKVIHLD